MALRDYMQDLLRAQSSGNDHHTKENRILKITVIDDNSSYFLKGFEAVIAIHMTHVVKEDHDESKATGCYIVFFLSLSLSSPVCYC
jgi:hypothetical protein